MRLLTYPTWVTQQSSNGNGSPWFKQSQKLNSDGVHQNKELAGPIELRKNSHVYLRAHCPHPDGMYVRTVTSVHGNDGPLSLGSMIYLKHYSIKFSSIFLFSNQYKENDKKLQYNSGSEALFYVWLEVKQMLRCMRTLLTAAWTQPQFAVGFFYTLFSGLETLESHSI